MPSQYKNRLQLERLEKREMLTADLSLVKDINAAGDDVFFRAQTKSHGAELWKTDGSPNGTRLVKDIAPGKDSTNPHHLVAMGDRVFFSVDGLGDELWVSDGTAAGTQLVTSFELITGIYEGGGKLFVVGESDDGYGLHSSDGTERGTRLVSSEIPDINRDTFSFGDSLFFTAQSSLELWKSDGTASGTHPLMEGLWYPNSFASIHGSLYFSANLGSHAHVWKSDGTSAGTDRLPNEIGSAQGIVEASGHKVILNASSFWLLDEFDDSTAGDELIPLSGMYDIRNLTSVNDTPLFSAKEFGNDHHSLFRFDISTRTATKLADQTLGNFAHSEDRLLIAQNDSILASDGTLDGTIRIPTNSFDDSYVVGADLFFYGTGDQSRELWRSDGTLAGTGKLADIDAPTHPSHLDRLTPVGDILMFRADDGVHGTALWKSDGTSEGTVMVKDICEDSNSGSPRSLAESAGKLYFFGSCAGGTSLWESDGTEQGTRTVFTSESATSSDLIVDVNDELFFRLADDGVGTELWFSDRTAAGTRLVKDINPGPANSTPGLATPVGDHLYFVANDGVHGRELWVSDGTSSGTRMVHNTHASSPDISDLTSMNGELFYIANTADRGKQLWKLSSPDSQPVQLTDVDKPEQATFADILEQVGDRLFFRIATEETGTELWVSDGTPAGTHPVADIRAGTESSSPANAVAVNGVLYFSAFTDAYGRELWRSDGTSAGTWMVRDIFAGESGGTVYALTEINGVLYFCGNDGIRGEELWKSDGTREGTLLQRQLAPGPEDSFPTTIIPVGNRLFVSADVADYGRELWSGLIDATAWQNPEAPTDVDNSGETTPLDALLVINELNDRRLSAPADGAIPNTPAQAPFLDVDNSRFVTPVDAITVINELQSTVQQVVTRGEITGLSPAVIDMADADHSMESNIAEPNGPSIEPGPFGAVPLSEETGVQENARRSRYPDSALSSTNDDDVFSTLSPFWQG